MDGNDQRLHVQRRSPRAEWISERLLAREREGAEHLCDGLVLDRARRIAIEVELTVKSRKRVTAILDELSDRHDAVLYYCAPAPHRQLTQLAETCLRVQHAFVQQTGWRLVEAAWTTTERHRLDELVVNKYTQDRWNRKR